MVGLRIILSSAILFSLISLFLPLGAFGQESLWEEFPPMPVSRSDYTGNVVGDKVYLIQGFDAWTNFTEYDAITGNYTELAATPYTADHTASAVHNGKIYVAGGCFYATPCSNFAVYDIATNTWNNLPNMPLPNWAPTAQIVGDDFFVIGGNPNFTACQKYNISTNTWSTCADLPTGREHLSSAVFENKIYVINGRGGFPGDATANEVYDPATNSWEILADKPTAMDGGWGGVFNNKIYVIGGGDPLTNVNEWYDPVTDSWTSGPDMPTKRHGLVCEPVVSKIFCFGGGLFNEGGSSTLVEVFDASSFFSNNATTANLTIIKDVVNDDSGINVPGDFTMVINATNPSDNNFAGVNSTGTIITIDPGAYSVDETGPGGYDASFSAQCSGTAFAGESYTCTITNDDQPTTANLCESLPTIGDWNVTSSCSLENNFSSPANVIIQDQVRLTILNNVTLSVPSGSSITILFGGSLVMEPNGTVIIIP